MNRSERRTKVHSILLGLGLLAFGAAGCVTSTVQEIRQATTGIENNETVVVMGRRNRPTTGQTEDNFIGCVSRHLESDKNFDVISEQDFVDQMFPWFEPRTAPVNTRDLPELLSQPVLAQRLRELGLKYVIWVDGNTQRSNATGSLSCSITPGAAGCFGFLTWDNDSNYEASVWDIHTGTSAGRVSTDAEGTSFMPAIVVPLPFIARVKANACSGLADQLSSFIVNEGADEA